MDNSENEFKVVPQLNTGRQVSGIGGWLILPLIGLFISIFKLGYILLGTFFPLLASGNWRVLTTPGSEYYDPLWGPVLVFEATGNLAFLIWVVVLLILLFSKSPAFPKTMIIFFVCNIAFLTIDMVLCRQIPLAASTWEESLGELVPVVIGALIWIPYFLTSERVKNTFTRD